MRELDAHNPPGGVLSGLLEAFLEILANVSPYEQRNEDSDRGAFEPKGHLIEALLNHLRIELAVELFVHEVRYVVQLRVDLGLFCTRVNRRRIGHRATVAPQSSITQDPVAKPSVHPGQFWPPVPSSPSPSVHLNAKYTTPGAHR